MSILTSKWLIALAVVAVILAVLYLAGRKSVHSEIVIPAPANAVWQVLTDTGAYRKWNTVLIPVEGEFAAGNTVRYEFNQDESTTSTIPTTVKQVVENELLNQGGGMPGVLTFDHRYVLEPVAGGTRVTIHEDYRGIGVNFWNPSPVQAAYERLNRELRDRVVSLQQGKD